MQRIVRLIESQQLIHVRRANQSAIERVGPSMIRALNRSGQLSVSVFNESTSAVATHIVKPVDLAAFVAHNDQTLLRYFSDKIVPGVRELALLPHQHPSRRKNPLLLLRKNFR